jgi:uncharacterized integral membrane protein
MTSDSILRQSQPESAEAQRSGRPPRITQASAGWAAVAAALLLLVLLIVFILQNPTKVELQFLGVEGSLPLGLAMLIAAVAGGVMVAIAGIPGSPSIR